MNYTKDLNQNNPGTAAVETEQMDINPDEYDTGETQTASCSSDKNKKKSTTLEPQPSCSKKSIVKMDYCEPSCSKEVSTSHLYWVRKVPKKHLNYRNLPLSASARKSRKDPYDEIVEGITKYFSKKPEPEKKAADTATVTETKPTPPPENFNLQYDYHYPSDYDDDDYGEMK